MSATLKQILDFADGMAFCVPHQSMSWEQFEGIKRADMWFRWEDGVWAWRPTKDAKFWIKEWLDWTPTPGKGALQLADMVRHMLSVPASEFQHDPAIPNCTLYAPTVAGMMWRADRTFALRHCEGYDLGPKSYPPRATLVNWFNDRLMPAKRGETTAEMVALDCFAFCVECGFNPPQGWIERVALPWIMPRAWRTETGWAVRLMPQ